MIISKSIFFSRMYKKFMLTFFAQIFFLVAFSQSDDGIRDTLIAKKEKVYHGVASFYSDKFNGRKTANGEIFDQNKYTAACNKLPLGTRIKVTNIKNGLSVIVRVNDRLHPKMNRIVDLSKAAAIKIKIISRGIAKVKVEVLEKNGKK